MINTANPSAGVYTYQQDLSQRIRGASTSIAAIVGPATKGPVGQRTLVTNTQEFIDTFGQPNAALTFMHHCALGFLAEGNQLYVTRVAKQCLYGGMRLTTVNNTCTAGPWITGYDTPDNIAFTPSDILAIYGRNQGEWNNNLRVVVFPDTNDIDQEQFVIQVYEGTNTQASEVHKGTIRFKVNGLGQQLQISEVVNRRSNLIRVKVNPINLQLQTNPNLALVNALATSTFAGGSNGTAINNTDIANAWELYSDNEELDVNILINGGYSNPTVQLKMDEIAQRRGDCMVILDPPSDQQATQDVINYRRNVLSLSSSYSTLYTPYLFVEDQVNGMKLSIPPSGHVAGTWARTDNNAAVWFAPAGLVRGRMNVLGLDQRYNLGQRNALEQSQVNCIRDIPGQGINVFGADTLQSFPSLLTNLHIQRLLNYIKKGAYLGSLFGVFEPNDAILAQRLIAIQQRFLQPILNNRGLLEFEVVDQTTDADRDNGDLVIVLYLTPVPYAKRIFINTVVNRLTSNVTFETGIVG